MNVSKNSFSERMPLIIFFCILFSSISAQSEIELNFNAPIIPFGKYSKSDLFFGMETIGYATIGYGMDFKYLYKIKNSRFKFGAGLNYFQNAHKSKQLEFASNNALGCDEDPFVCGFYTYFGWDVLYKVTDWKNLDLNLITSVNILSYKKLQYNILLNAGATMHFSPTYYYNIGFDDELDSQISFSFNVGSEQNIKFKLTKNIFINASLFYRLSKVHAKFTKNLVGEYVYYDFWQQTLGSKFGLVYVFNKKAN